MLIAVVEDGNLRAEMLDGVAPCHSALRADEHRDVRQMLCEHERLVARRLGIHLQRTPVGNDADLAAPLGTVAAVENRDAVAHIGNLTREVLRRWGLARPADCDVAETDDVAVEPLLLCPAPPVHGEFEVDQLLVDEREHIEHAHDEPARNAAHLFIMHEIDEVCLKVRDLLRRADAMPDNPLLRTNGAARFIGFKHLDKNACRFLRRAFVLVDDGKGLRLEPRTLRSVAKETQRFARQLFTVRYGDDGIAVAEQRVNVLEIEHLIADDDRLAVRRRFQDIMSAVRDETAADVDDIAESIDAPELAHRVEDNDVLAARGVSFLQLLARRNGKARLAAKVLHLKCAQHLTRRNDQAHARVFLAHRLERGEDKLLLPAMGRARDHDPACARKSEFLDERGALLRADARIRLVEFCIARHRDQLARRAETHDIVGVDGGLHGKAFHRADHLAQHSKEVFVLLDAAVADASVDHHDGDVELLRFFEEIRPELRLNRQEHARPDAPHDA